MQGPTAQGSGLADKGDLEGWELNHGEGIGLECRPFGESTGQRALLPLLGLTFQAAQKQDVKKWRPIMLLFLNLKNPSQACQGGSVGPTQMGLTSCDF